MFNKNKFLILAKNLYQTAVVTIAILASLFTIIGGILALQNFDEFKTWYDKNFLTKEYWLKAANSLSPEENVSVFDEKLGKPVYSSKYKDLENRTYVNDYFYTQAMVDSSQTVRLFSITIRKSDFYPQIPYLLSKKGRSYELGKMTYGEARSELGRPLSLEYYPGSNRSIYSEMYYEGNPGNYLYYFLTSNDAGVDGRIDFGAVKFFSFEDTGLFKGCNSNIPLLGAWDNSLMLSNQNIKNALDTSKSLYPNTITVTDRDGTIFCEYKDFFEANTPTLLGPDLAKVRLLRL